MLRDSVLQSSVKTRREREAALSGTARAIFQQALLDCSIERAFAERISIEQHAGHSTQVLLGGHRIDLSSLRHVRVVAAGKAARRMLLALLERLPQLADLDLRGVLIAPDAEELLPGFEYFCGGHPFPNEASFAAARAVLRQLRSLPGNRADSCLCLFLISGGASAMMELPLDPSISLEDTRAFHRALVHSGASIFEINCVRKHFSAVKGGRLAAAAAPARCITILLSDVPEGHLDTIASGPTIPDRSTVAECAEILDRFRLIEEFPRSVQRFFTSDQLIETVKPAEMDAATFTILSAGDLAEAARRRAEERGFRTIVDNTCDDWDYRDAAGYLLQRIREYPREQRPLCLVSAGEIVVRPPLGNNQEWAIANGNGGRNQHFALHAATLLEDSDFPIAVLSAGSDGIDGHSDAAGAVVGSQMLSALDPESTAKLRAVAKQALTEFHSSTFLGRMGATIVTGPTGNNLRDLRILLLD